MPFRVKAIKPPRNAINSIAYEAALRRALNVTAETVIKDFQAVTRTWKHKVQFLSNRSTTSGPRGSLFLTVFARDPSGIFHFVNKGTRAHIIRPKNGKMLRFHVPFAPKSLPLSLGARSGNRGDTAVFRDVVRHPGIKARRFDVVIARKNQQTLARAVDAEFRKLTGR